MTGTGTSSDARRSGSKSCSHAVAGRSGITARLCRPQLGFAKEDRNQIAGYQGLGLNFTGLVPGRPDDVAGIAVARARNGDHIMVFDTMLVRAETAVEISYLFSPFPWLTLQPDLQYIIDPGTSSTTQDAVIASMRMALAF